MFGLTVILIFVWLHALICAQSDSISGKGWKDAKDWAFYFSIFYVVMEFFVDYGVSYFV